LLQKNSLLFGLDVKITLALPLWETNQTFDYSMQE